MINVQTHRKKGIMRILFTYPFRSCIYVKRNSISSCAVPTMKTIKQFEFWSDMLRELSSNVLHSRPFGPRRNVH